MSPSTYTDLLYACASSRVRSQFVLMGAEGAETNVENVLGGCWPQQSEQTAHAFLCRMCIPDTAILCYVKRPLGYVLVELYEY